MSAYYNEFEPYAAAWLRNLIARNLIAPGEVDERSIADVQPEDLKGFTQCHFFAGIGGWSLALRMAGWSDERPVWTGSCPCQPFSNAGRQQGAGDERHLWPQLHRLVAERRPPIVLGEQVASKLGRGWLAGVRADLEALGYGVGAADLCAAGVGAPHVRQRLWWVADAGCGSDERGVRSGEAPSAARPDAGETRERQRCGTDAGVRGGTSGLADASGERRDGQHARVRSEDEGRQPACAVPEAARRGEHGGWDSFVWLPCADGKARRIEPGLEPLAHGVSGRVAVERTWIEAGAEVRETHWYSRIGALKGLGNAIVPEVAAAFIRAYLNT